MHSNVGMATHNGKNKSDRNVQRDHQEHEKADVEDETRMVVDGVWLLLF